MKTKEEILLPVLGNIHPSNYSALLDAMEEYAKAYYEDKKQPSAPVADRDNYDYLRGFSDGYGGPEPHECFPEGFKDINEVMDRAYELKQHKSQETLLSPDMSLFYMENIQKHHEDKPATRYFNVSYVFNKNGLGYGNTNITATGDNGPYMEKLKVLEIISESSGAPVNSIVISNIIEMNESDYKQWIR